MSRASTGCLSDVQEPRVLMEQREYMNHCPPPDPGTGCSVPGTNKVLSRNANGTIAMTSQPTNESELQLYRVLQRANLLSYYDTFIGQGGDDVQQLCEAGEEEFLEIMALVGMASKPLHVRRLQKALQEWVNNPVPCTSDPMFMLKSGGSSSYSSHSPMFQTPMVPNIPGPGPGHPIPMARPMNLSQHNHLPPTRPSPPIPMIPNNHPPSPSLTKETAPSPTPLIPPPMAQANGAAAPDKEKQESCPPFYLFFKGSEHNSGGDYGQPGSPLQLTPVLVECQIQRLAEAAELLVKALPPFEPKPQNSKKKICKELEYVMSMAEDDPRRMDEIRKYAAIYGRFDCKRKPEKPLTLHEVSVNEAAAQICKHIPALLTRRDELFPLARQVVRDSGYQYSKGHSTWGDNSRSQNYNPRNYNNCDDPSGKRARLDGSPDGSSKHGGEMGRLKRQERLENIVEELKQLGMQQEELRARLTQARDAQDFPMAQQLQQQLEQLNAQQVQMIAEQSDLIKRQRHQQRCYNSKGNGRMSSCSDPDRPDTDDTDSQYSFSNTSSPSQDVHDSSSQDYPLPTQTSSAGGELKVPLQVQDMFPLKGNSKKSNAHITKQMMQETLMDEGLRVVKELSSQIKEDPDGLTPMSLSMAMAISAAGGDGLTSPLTPSSHPQHPSQHHMLQSYRYACAMGMPPGGSATNGTPVSRERDCRPNSNGQGPESSAPSNDVEKAAASTINALLSLSQNAGRGMKQEVLSPNCPTSE